MTTTAQERRTTTATALAATAVGLGVRAIQLRAPLADATAVERAQCVEIRSEVAYLTPGARRPDEATWSAAALELHHRETAAADGWCPHCQEPVRCLPDQVSLDDVLLDPIPHPAGDVRIVDVAGYVRAQRDRDHRIGRGVKYRRHETVCPRWPARPNTCTACSGRLHQLLIDDGIAIHPGCETCPTCHQALADCAGHLS